MKIIGKILSLINAIILLITLLGSYDGVKENLDGWHDFSEKHAMLFVVLCIGMIGICIYNMFTTEKKIFNFFGNGALILFPMYFHTVVTNLKGNVETDVQYLILRTFQGFESTYVLLMLIAIINFVNLCFIKGKQIQMEKR